MSTGTGLVGAFAFGFALGAAPGPVQLLILTQTATRGLAGGLRVMLGANLTALAILLALALGLSALAPSEATVRLLRVVGGGFLVALAVLELRTLANAGLPEPPAARSGRIGPTLIGMIAVVLNPGAWLFFTTTAAAVLATAAADHGRTAAVATAIAIGVGVSASDLTFTVVGSGGRRILGDRGIRWVRGALAVALGALGFLFVVQGFRG